MGDKPRLKVSGVADGGRVLAGDIHVLGQDKLDAFDQHVPAGRGVVRGDGHGLHAALMLVAFLVNLGQHNAERGALAGADAFQVDVQLQNAAERFQRDIARVINQRVLAPADGDVDRFRAGFRHHHNAAVDHHRRGGE